jgi:hypothetical protein
VTSHQQIVIRPDVNPDEPLLAYANRFPVRDRFGVGALALYAMLAVAFFARPLFSRFSTAYIGQGADPASYIWALVWWPHALANRLNPFLTHAIWAPQGINLTWRTTIPLLSVLAYPITRLHGPIAAHNVLCILSPTLAAWTAFILLRYVSERYVPALIGGYVFGFSSYMVAQLLFGHVFLVMVCLVPFGVYIVLLAINGQIAWRTFVTVFGFLVAAQSLISLEIAATSTIVGAIALGLALAMGDGLVRQQIRQVLLPFAAGYGVAALLLSPFIYYLFAYGMPAGPIWPPGAMSVDLLNFVIPTRTNLLGSLAIFVKTSDHFHLNLGEEDAYFGLIMIGVAIHFGYRNWRDLKARVLIIMVLVTSVLALGPRVHMFGRIGFGLPWKIFLHIPFIDKAAPSRFSMYAFLALAAILSLWLKDYSVNRNLRAACAAVIVLCLLPDFSTIQWVQRAESPKFFSSGMHRSYVRPDETLLVLPYGPLGQSMIWQAQTGMYFRMAEGQFEPRPYDSEQWPISIAFYSMTDIPGEGEQLRAFLAAHNADMVVVDRSDSNVRFWQHLADTLDVAPVDIGGVSLYRIPASRLSAYANVSALEMEETFDEERFYSLLRAANEYIAAAHPLSALAPRAVQDLGLLPPNWVKDREVRTRNGLWLGPWNDGRVSVGIDGSFAALEPLIRKYQPYAHAVYFPYPRQLGTDGRIDNSAIRLLIMVFDREALAAAMAAEKPPIRP